MCSLDVCIVHCVARHLCVWIVDHVVHAIILYLERVELACWSGHSVCAYVHVHVCVYALACACLHICVRF